MPKSSSAVQLPEEVRHLFAELSDEERKVAIRIFSEMGKEGISATLDSLWHQDYQFRPPDIDQFIEDKNFLGESLADAQGKLGGAVWPAWRETLREVTEGAYSEAVLTGAIGCGKSLAGNILLGWDICRILCLREPQRYYNSVSSKPLVFGLFNLTQRLALHINYIPFRALLARSPFFRSQMGAALDEERMFSDRFIHVGRKLSVALGSQAIHSLGADAAGGVLDEANFRAPSKDVNEVANLYLNMSRRMKSRYIEHERRLPGHLILISSKQYSTSFLERHIEEVRHDPSVYTVSFALYDAKPRERWSGVTFRVLLGDQYRDARILKPGEKVPPELESSVENVPEEFKTEYERDIDSAVRDISGKSTKPLGSLIPGGRWIRGLITEGRKHPFSVQTIEDSLEDPSSYATYLKVREIARRLPAVGESRERWVPLRYPKAARYIHIDLAQSGDCAGIAMGARAEPKAIKRYDRQMDREQEYLVSRIYYDFAIQIRAKPGSEIDFAKVNEFVLYIIGLGFRVKLVTFDWWQSVASQQFLKKQKVNVEQFSVDRDDRAYVAFRGALLDSLASLYDYPVVTDLKRGEIVQLVWDRVKHKVDHQPDAGKDVSDCLAAVAWHILEGETLEAEDVSGAKYASTLEQTRAVLRQQGTQAQGPARAAVDDAWLLSDYEL